MNCTPDLGLTSNPFPQTPHLVVPSACHDTPLIAGDIGHNAGIQCLGFVGEAATWVLQQLQPVKIHNQYIYTRAERTRVTEREGDEIAQQKPYLGPFAEGDDLAAELNQKGSVRGLEIRSAVGIIAEYCRTGWHARTRKHPQPAQDLDKVKPQKDPTLIISAPSAPRFLEIVRQRHPPCRWIGPGAGSPALMGLETQWFNKLPHSSHDISVFCQVIGCPGTSLLISHQQNTTYSVEPFKARIRHLESAMLRLPFTTDSV